MQDSTRVTDFISRFHEYKEIDDVFTNGCCYWFAFILVERFKNYNAQLVYDQVVNHFGAQIGNCVYDITGDVTNQYNWEEWRTLDDVLLVSRINRDCIMF